VTVTLGLQADVHGSAGFDFDAKAEYKLYRTYVATGYVWTHVLNNVLAKHEVRA